MILALTTQIVSYFSHYSKVKIEKQNKTKLNKKMKHVFGHAEGQTWTIRKTSLNTHPADQSFWTPISHQTGLHWTWQINAGCLSYNHASRMRTSLRERRNGWHSTHLWDWGPTWLRGNAFGNDSYLGETSVPTLVLHPHIYSLTPTQSRIQSEVIYEFEPAGNHRLCPIQYKKHHLSIYQLPGSGPGTTVFSKPFPDPS